MRPGKEKDILHTELHLQKPSPLLSTAISFSSNKNLNLGARERAQRLRGLHMEFGSQHPCWAAHNSLYLQLKNGPISHSADAHSHGYIPTRTPTGKVTPATLGCFIFSRQPLAATLPWHPLSPLPGMSSTLQSKRVSSFKTPSRLYLVPKVFWGRG